MNKPNDYENTQEYGEFTPLELGGHICQIMSVEETKSSTRKDMLIISLDTAKADRQPGYYTEQWKSDTRPEKKWGCRVFQLVYDNDGHTNRGLKTFITAVENSNKGFKAAWGDKFAASFKGKLVGGVFGREQYENTKGELKFSTKCVQFRSIDKVLDVEIPTDKLLQGQAQAPSNNQSPSMAIGNLEGFEEIIGDDDLPF